MPYVEGIVSEVVGKMSCKHRVLFFGSGGYYIICAECSSMWVARDPMKSDDVPYHDFDRSAKLTDKDIRVDPNNK